MGRDTALVLLGIIVLVGGWFIYKTVGRYQAVADARNQVVINAIRIQQTHQLVEVEQQKAQIRIVEAKGIAEAQRIINATLTPLYLQHEAIKAQERMANSPNHTQIYVPVGSNGLPLVFTAP